MYLGSNVSMESLAVCRCPPPSRAAGRPPPLTSCTRTTVTTQQGHSGPAGSRVLQF